MSGSRKSKGASFGFVRGPKDLLRLLLLLLVVTKVRFLEMVVAQSVVGVAAVEKSTRGGVFLPTGKEATDERFPHLEVKQEA